MDGLTHIYGRIDAHIWQNKFLTIYDKYSRMSSKFHMDFNMSEKKIVTMDNHLVRASYRLSVNELRLLLVVLAQMPKLDDDEQLDPHEAYYVTKDDFVRLGCEPKNAAREIRGACSDLLSRTVTVNLGYDIELHTHWVHNVLTFKTETFKRLKEEYPNSKNDEEFINKLRMHNLIDTLPFILKSDENLMARIVLHENIIPYVAQLKKNFTKINLDDLAGFGSFYSYRIFFILMQWRNKGKVVLGIDELRNSLELDNKYPLFADLKRRVIDVAIEEINEYTAYNVDANLIKKGRKYTNVEFIFSPKRLEDDKLVEFTDTTKLIKMTPPQRSMFAGLLANMPELGEYAPVGASMAEYAAMIAEDLDNPEKVEFYRPYLKKLGFVER